MSPRPAPPGPLCYDLPIMREPKKKDETEFQFEVGQVVHHRMFDYRGVVVQADPDFRLSEDWYEMMARSRPPKDRPWYRVLVDGSDDETYVAERNLEADDSGVPVDHPLLGQFFDEFRGRFYVDTRSVN